MKNVISVLVAVAFFVLGCIVAITKPEISNGQLLYAVCMLAVMLVMK